MISPGRGAKTWFERRVGTDPRIALERSYHKLGLETPLGRNWKPSRAGYTAYRDQRHDCFGLPAGQRAGCGNAEGAVAASAEGPRGMMSQATR